MHWAEWDWLVRCVPPYSVGEMGFPKKPAVGCRAGWLEGFFFFFLKITG